MLKAFFIVVKTAAKQRKNQKGKIRMRRRNFLQGLLFFLGLAAAKPAQAASYRFTANATGSVLNQTASRLRVNVRFYAGLGPMVAALNGYGGRWVFTVNGNRIGCAAAGKTVYPKDVVEWRTV